MTTCDRNFPKPKKGCEEGEEEEEEEEEEEATAVKTLSVSLSGKEVPFVLRGGKTQKS